MQGPQPSASTREGDEWSDTRLHCPFPGCTRSFKELWRLKVHYRAPVYGRGSGVERGHAQELPFCPACSEPLGPDKRYHKCAAAGARRPPPKPPQPKASHTQEPLPSAAQQQPQQQQERSQHEQQQEPQQEQLAHEHPALIWHNPSSHSFGDSLAQPPLSAPLYSFGLEMFMAAGMHLPGGVQPGLHQGALAPHPEASASGAAPFQHAAWQPPTAASGEGHLRTLNPGDFKSMHMAFVQHQQLQHHHHQQQQQLLQQQQQQQQEQQQQQHHLQQQQQEQHHLQQQRHNPQRQHLHQQQQLPRNHHLQHQHQHHEHLPYVPGALAAAEAAAAAGEQHLERQQQQRGVAAGAGSSHRFLDPEPWELICTTAEAATAAAAAAAAQLDPGEEGMSASPSYEPPWYMFERAAHAASGAGGSRSAPPPLNGLQGDAAAAAAAAVAAPAGAAATAAAGGLQAVPPALQVTSAGSPSSTEREAINALVGIAAGSPTPRSHPPAAVDGGAVLDGIGAQQHHGNECLSRMYLKEEAEGSGEEAGEAYNIGQSEAAFPPYTTAACTAAAAAGGGRGEVGPSSTRKACQAGGAPGHGSAQHHAFRPSAASQHPRMSLSHGR